MKIPITDLEEQELAEDIISEVLKDTSGSREDFFGTIINVQITGARRAAIHRLTREGIKDESIAHYLKRSIGWVRLRRMELDKKKKRV